MPVNILMTVLFSSHKKIASETNGVQTTFTVGDKFDEAKNYQWKGWNHAIQITTQYITTMRL